MRRPLIAAMLALLPTLAAAQPQSRLQNGGHAVPVWRSSDALSEGLRLIEAGVHRSNPALVARLLSCMANEGSPIVVTDGGFFSSTVLVVSGRNSGCRGVVVNEMIGRGS